MDARLLAPEKWAWRLGYHRVAGTDEAGRGALAGPLVAAAVVLPSVADLEGLADSKQLTPKRRMELFRRIADNAEDWAWACISPSEIDSGGLQGANMKAMREAVYSLDIAPDLVLVDNYRISGLGIPQWSITRGDTLSRCIAAASIMAKVARDHLMWFWSVRFPQYGFEYHKGYGTRRHLEAISDHGPCLCHRYSFSGVGQMKMGWME